MPDWKAVQRDRDAGELTIRAIAEKYGVSEANIYLHTKTTHPRRTGRPPAKPAPASQASAKRPPGGRAVPGPGVEGLDLAYVPLSDVPGRAVGHAPGYVAVYAALKKCPRGQAVRVNAKAISPNSRYPTGALRSALVRQARAEGREDLLAPRFRIKDGKVWVFVVAR